MTRIQQFLARFRRDDRGSIAVETVIILPMLFWAYLSMFAIFDAYRQHAINQKVAYTIGDIISRETNPVTPSYMNGARELVRYLSSARQTSDVAIRVTSVRWDGNNNIYRRDWSEKRGWVSRLSNNEVQALASRLPTMPHNERVMIVETFVKYDPPFNTGLQNRTITNFVFTRPRYAPRVLWDCEC